MFLPNLKEAKYIPHNICLYDLNTTFHSYLGAVSILDCDPGVYRTGAASSWPINM